METLDTGVGHTLRLSTIQAQMSGGGERGKGNGRYHSRRCQQKRIGFLHVRLRLLRRCAASAVSRNQDIGITGGIRSANPHGSTIPSCLTIAVKGRRIRLFLLPPRPHQMA